MEDIGLQVGLLLVILLLLERLASLRGWSGPTVAGVSVLTWAAVTALALWCEAVFAFVALHLVLFTLGSGATTAGLVLTAAGLVATPVAVLVALRQTARRSVSHH